MTKLKKVLIMAGGTGGHVFPGLAMAKYFQEKGIEIQWLGTRKGLEARLVPQAGFVLNFISISGLRGKGLKALFMLPWRLLIAIFQAGKVIQNFKPDVVLGMGGFVSGPGGIASFLLRKKLVIHEQNAYPGLTNVYLSKVATKILEGFPNTFTRRKNVVSTGNPVRKEIASLPSPKARVSDNNTHLLRLLVVGGSLGAEAFNQLLPGALAKLPATIRLEIWHQTGEKHCVDTSHSYQHQGINAEVVPFIDAMDKAYSWADVVLCRAGALTIAELCAAGSAAILVPFPYAVDDHQTANASFMVKHHAAILMQQTELTEHRLITMLIELCHAVEKRQAMAEAAYSLRKVDATESVFHICEEICH